MFAASVTVHDVQRQEDFVIAVMGRTGTGKSSFVQLVSGDPSIGIGDGLESETSKIQVVRFVDPSGRGVVIVDTPGFGDSRPGINDTKILEEITMFLLQHYDNKKKLNGLIYLQRISDNRFDAQSKQNLRMFSGLCGSRNFKNVIIVTTFWDQIQNEEEGEWKEEILKARYFNALVNWGGSFMRHDRTKKTACEILDHIFTFTPTNVQIQEEIRVEGKRLQDTEAGTLHTAEMKRLRDEHEKELANLKGRLEMETSKSIKDLKSEVNRLERRLADLKKSQETWTGWMEVARMVCALLPSALQWHAAWMSKR